MAVGHADAADDRSDDAHKPLVGSTQENVGQVSRSVKLFFGCSIDGTVVMKRESTNRFGGKNVRVDHVPAKVGHESDR